MKQKTEVQPLKKNQKPIQTKNSKGKFKRYLNESKFVYLTVGLVLSAIGVIYMALTKEHPVVVFSCILLILLGMMLIEYTMWKKRN